MFDSSLRTPVVYAIAIRYQTPLWRAGAILRAGCMAGFWVLLSSAPPTIGHGKPSPSPDANPFRRAAAMRPSLLDQVVHNRTELGIWQELARFDKRQEIANAAHVHPRTLDAFTAAKCAALDAVNAYLPRQAPAPEPTASGGAHSANLIRVIHFARVHVQFFADEEVAGLLAAHWRTR